MSRAPPEIWAMRSRTPYPCRSPSDAAFRIRRSSVPGSRSAWWPMTTPSGLRIVQVSPNLSRRATLGAGFVPDAPNDGGDVGRPLAQPAHEVGKPFAPERNVHTHAMALPDERGLKVAAHAVQ